MRTKKRHLLVLFSELVMVYPLFILPARQHPVDNLTVLNNMASTVVEKVITKLSPDSSTSILIHSQSQQHIGNWWMENWFVKTLAQKGVSKIYVNQMDSSSIFTVDFQILALGVNYLRTEKKNMLERRLNLSLSVRAVEGSSGLIRFVDDISEQYVDTIQIRDVNRLENKDFYFSQASLPEQQISKKLIEPLIVMTTTAVIIYLFFHLRSN